jgi:nucleobase:cation symporter-1, NCS1 family
MKNYFSASSHLLTKDFIGLVIWMALFIPMLLIKPEHMQIPLGVSFVFFVGTCIGLLAW